MFFNIFKSLFENVITDLLKTNIENFLLPKNLDAEKKTILLNELLTKLEIFIKEEDNDIGIVYSKNVAIICYKLSIIYFEIDEITSIDFSQKYIQEAILRIDLLNKKEKYNIFIQAAKIAEKQNDYKNSIKYYFTALKYANKRENIYYKIAKNYFLLNKYNKAHKLIKKSFQKNKKNLEFLELKALIIGHINKNNYLKKAINLQYFIIENYRKNENKIKLSNAYMNLAILKIYNNEIEEAVELFKNAEFLSENLNKYHYKNKFINLYYYLSFLSNNKDKQLEYANKHIEFLHDYTKYEYIFLENFSELLVAKAALFYNKNTNLEFAYKLLNKAIQIQERILTKYNSKIEFSYHYMMLLCNKLEKYNKAIYYEKKAMKVNLKLENYFYLRHNYKNISKLYLKLKNNKKALKYARKDFLFMIYLLQKKDKNLYRSLFTEHLI